LSVSPTVTVDLSELDAAIKRAEKAGIDMRPAWRTLRSPFRKDQGAHMKAQQGPRGKWPGLAAATREKRMKQLTSNRKNFTRKGKLKKSAKRSVGRVLSRRLLSRAKVKIYRRAMLIRTPGAAAAVHQTGGPVGRGQQVPARTFMWVSDEMARKGAAALADHLRAAWHGRKLAA